MSDLKGETAQGAQLGAYFASLVLNILYFFVIAGSIGVVGPLFGYLVAIGSIWAYSAIAKKPATLEVLKSLRMVNAFIMGGFSLLGILSALGDSTIARSDIAIATFWDLLTLVALLWTFHEQIKARTQRQKQPKIGEKSVTKEGLLLENAAYYSKTKMLTRGKKVAAKLYKDRIVLADDAGAPEDTIYFRDISKLRNGAGGFLITAQDKRRSISFVKPMYMLFGVMGIYMSGAPKIQKEWSKQLELLGANK